MIINQVIHNLIRKYLDNQLTHKNYFNRLILIESFCHFSYFNMFNNNRVIFFFSKSNTFFHPTLFSLHLFTFFIFYYILRLLRVSTMDALVEVLVNVLVVATSARPIFLQWWSPSECPIYYPFFISIF